MPIQNSINCAATPYLQFITAHAENSIEGQTVEQKIAILLKPYWTAKDLNRPVATKALSGMLIRTYAWPLQRVKQALRVICAEAKDTRLEARLKAADQVARALQQEIPHAQGIPTLIKMFGRPTVNELMAIIPQGKEEPLPEIDAAIQNLEVASSLSWNALQQANDPPRLFRQGNCARRMERGDDGTLILRDLTASVLRHELARAARWYSERPNEKGQTVRADAKPPMDVVQDMLAAPNLPLPPLNRITETPVFAPDGTLQLEVGYHEAARTYYEPSEGFSLPDVPERPTAGDIARARNLLLDDLLGDFPFLSESDRAHAVALLVLPFARDLISGPTPLHLIEAPTPGSGKGLLVDAVLGPSCGRSIGLLMQTTDEDEWRKRLTARIREARPVICIDNITKPLDSGVLAGALTARIWEDRLLGANQTISLPVRCIWVATANNPTMSTEIARRSIRIRLDPDTDRPWLRDGFKHPDLRGWIDEHRGELVWAALTLICVWIATDRPRPQVKPLGSYEDWSFVIGGILAVAGVPGFLGNLSEFYEASDSEGDAWRALVSAWAEQFGQKSVAAADLFPLAVESQCFDFKDAGQRAA
ncbi:MAG: hypothetical protein H0W99_12805, partial [Acidobacteria bacterium]|nr:hypothetical protein [Acidobacteriota bacterium]